MKKVKLGASLILLVLLAILTNSFSLIINYLLALTLHELAHLFVATKLGYSLKFIKLDMFGLSIELNEAIADKDSFKINVAGPVFNLLLCVICMALYWLLPLSYFYLNTFCFANLVLAIFNLLPIYPLDGYRIVDSFCRFDNKFLQVMRQYSTLIYILVIITGVYSFLYNNTMAYLVDGLVRLFSWILGM